MLKRDVPNLFFLSLVVLFRFIPATVIITTELPYGSGLGSSAAFCVALTAALIASSSSDKTRGDGWSSLDETNLELLNKWAFEGEKIIHGKPSGIDNTVSAYGQFQLLKHLNPSHQMKTICVCL